jgi:dUTP pyrophosphatase
MKEEFRDIPIYREHDCKCTIKPGLSVKLKRTHLGARFPRYAQPGDAGMDLFAVSIEETPDYIEYNTGIALEIPKGYVALLFPRSSNSKKDLILANSAGVIDSGYRGDLKLRYKLLTNGRKKLNKNIYEIGDAIAQIMILPYPQINFIEVDELCDSERGVSGFGSTGN